MADSHFALSIQNIVEQIKDNVRYKNTLKATQTSLDVWQTWPTGRSIIQKIEEYEHKQLKEEQQQRSFVECVRCKELYEIALVFQDLWSLVRF